MITPEAISALLKSDDLKAVADKHGVQIDAFSKAFESLGPRFNDGTADLGGFGLAMLSGAYMNIPEQQRETKGQELIDILFKDQAALDGVITEASGASGVAEDKIRTILPDLACFVANTVTKAMSSEGNEIFDVLTGGSKKKLV